MSRSAAAFLLLAGVAIPLHRADAARYENIRFGYAITYPADLLIAQPEADNGDGRIFRARHGAARLSVWGAYDVTGQSPAEIARDYRADCHGGRLAFSIATPGLIAFSCTTPNGRILYQKMLRQGCVLMAIRFVYPRAEHDLWDAVVQRVAASLHPVSGPVMKPGYHSHE